MYSSAWLTDYAYHFVADSNVREAGVWMLRYRLGHLTQRKHEQMKQRQPEPLVTARLRRAAQGTRRAAAETPGKTRHNPRLIRV